MIKPNGYWTKERCAEAALQYETRSAFSTGCKSGYRVAQQHQWLDDICGHMTSSQKPNGYWTYELCRDAALQYETRSAFSKGSGAAYSAARKLNIVDEVCSHMKSSVHKVPRGYWYVKENVAAEALKYTCRDHFERRSKGAFKAAKKYGWYDEITQHFVLSSKPDGYWTYELCRDAAAKYTNRTAFNQNDHAAYKAAWRRGWIDSICSHMEMELWTREVGMVYLYPLNASKHLCKLGICEEDINSRTKRVANQLKDSLSVVFAIKSKNVKSTEYALKQHGMPVKLSELSDVVVEKRRRKKLPSGEVTKILDGYTEMRWSSPDDFAAKLDVMREHSLDGRVTLHKDIGGSLKPVLFI